MHRVRSRRHTWFTLSALVCLALSSLMAPASARECGPRVLARLLAPGGGAIRLACSLRLRPRDLITRRVVIAGDVAGIVLDCNGARLGGEASTTGEERDILVIRSLRRGRRWLRPRDITIRDCRIHGSIRIFGMGQNGQAPNLRRSSRRPGHTRRAQAAAPTRITFENVTIVGRARIPFYVAPGVTEVRLLRSRITGHSVSTAIYLDAESARNELIDNVIDVKSAREAIAVDGSADNVISRNEIRDYGRGAVFLYRNCGEGGTIRHQPPAGNRITDNRIVRPPQKLTRSLASYVRGLIAGRTTLPAIWLGSRQGHRLYCDRDAGFPFGSSVDDKDHATRNIVVHNLFVGYSREDAIVISDSPNTVGQNRFVRPTGK